MTTPIRAIVSHFSFNFSHAAMDAVLRARPFEFCGIIGRGDGPRLFSSLAESAQQWFDSGKIRSCRYDVAFTDLLPLDEELIDSMTACEMLFMEILCRHEWKYEIPYAERRRQYLKQLRFWNDYISRHRINLYVTAWIPHQIPDVIIYHLCKLHGIPVVYFHMSTERDTAFIEHDIEESAVQLGQRYEELLREFKNVSDPEAIPLSRFQDRYRALTGAAGEKPALEQISMYTSYGQRLRSLLSMPFLILWYGFQYLTPRGLVRAWQALVRSRLIRERDAFYTANAITPDLTVPYVYYPLHLQPEASTVPMGGAFADQVMLARLLSQALPPGVLIYVKEHYKKSSWLGRTLRDYKDLLALRNVRLIALDVSTFALREHCCAVATVTGTAGFEGLFRGKPCLMFGHRFYQYARGVYKIHSANDLRRAMDDVFVKKLKPTPVECRLFLKAMEETCVHGTVNPWDRKVSHLTDEEHGRANSGALIGELEKIDSDIVAVK